MHFRRKGKTLHLLKQSAKPVSYGRKRRKFEVIEPDYIDELRRQDVQIADLTKKKQDTIKDVNMKETGSKAATTQGFKIKM